MPAEWEPHEATWIAWPHNPTDWPGRFQPIAWVYADIIRHLSREEQVHILMNDTPAREKALKLLRYARVETQNVHFHAWPTDRVWTRDSGAIFVKNKAGEVAATDWRFNAWAKYPDWKLDDKVAARMAKECGVQSWQPMAQVEGKQVRVVLEGGSIDVNGRGSMLTTEECLLSNVQQRNPGLDRADIEKVFADYLGVTNVIWLNKGIAGDDTHGHVDDLARFVSPNTVVTMVEQNKSDENHEPLKENVELLKRAKDQDGNPLRVVPMQMPAPVVIKGQRVPASYANFYIANGRVLVPTFDDPNDRLALNTLAELFPEREVVGIHCGDFIWGLGAIHCMTQQEPKGSF